MKMKDPRGEIDLLLRILDEAYEKKAWHGPNLRGSIRGVSEAAAAWRPEAGRHNIWEIVVHAAYWKYAAHRRLRGEKRGSFDFKGSNWFPRPVTLTEGVWHQDVALLGKYHSKLREAVAELPLDELHRTPAGSKVSNATLIYGMASHDIYHAGQIQLLKRLHS